MRIGYLASLLAVLAVAGCKGSTGTVGQQGPQGDPGPQGNQGIQGIPGPQGGAGPQGVQGIQGPQGDVGPQGVQGIQGPQGNPGAPGAAGAQGIQGTPGAQGPKGLNWRGAWATGTTYAADDAVMSGGSAWVAVTPTTGVAPLAPDWSLLASAGADGAQGPAGVQGPQGIQGIQGAQGVQGPAGADGAQGLQGIQGPPGADGAQGPAGAQGPQGIQGIQGVAGGPLLTVLDGSGAPLGAAYYFDGALVAVRETYAGGTALVFRAIETGLPVDAVTLYFTAADCSDTPRSINASPAALLNSGSLYQRITGTLANVALLRERPPGGGCVATAQVNATFQMRLLGTATTLVAPLDVAP